MKLRTQRRLALGARIVLALPAVAYGAYWCMEPGKNGGGAHEFHL